VTSPAAHPYYLHALRDELRERGVSISCDTLWRFLKRQEISFKKTLFADEQDRADVARRRLRWKKYQARIDPSRLVFIDENMRQRPIRCRRAIFMQSGFCLRDTGSSKWLRSFRFQRAGSGCSAGATTNTGRTAWATGGKAMARRRRSLRQKLFLR